MVIALLGHVLYLVIMNRSWEPRIGPRHICMGIGFGGCGGFMEGGPDNSTMSTSGLHGCSERSEMILNDHNVREIESLHI